MQGTQALPPHDFKYQMAFRHGRPRHRESDAFSVRHPAMDPSRRAKIFAPFDALRGFSGAVASKEILYEPYRELDEERLTRLNRKLAVLQPLVRSGAAARENQVRIGVTRFILCDDPDSEFNGILGQYTEQVGILKKIDLIRGQLLLDDCLIDLDDIFDIRDPEDRLFRRMEEDGSESND